MVRERARRIDARGFTLAELGMVLAVVGLLSAIAAPALLSYWQTSTLGAGALELAGTINHARQLAISLNAPVCVATDRGRLRLESVSANACMGVPLAVSGPTAFELASGLVVENAGPSVVLTSLGAAIPGGTFSVTHPVTGARRTVVIAASGRVSVR